jgi:hypothetical protein
LGPSTCPAQEADLVPLGVLFATGGFLCLLSCRRPRCAPLNSLAGLRPRRRRERSGCRAQGKAAVRSSHDPWGPRTCLGIPARGRMGSVGGWPLARLLREQRESAAGGRRCFQRGPPGLLALLMGGLCPAGPWPGGCGRYLWGIRGGWRMPCGRRPGAAGGGRPGRCASAPRSITKTSSALKDALSANPGAR